MTDSGKPLPYLTAILTAVPAVILTWVVYWSIVVAVTVLAIGIDLDEWKNLDPEDTETLTELAAGAAWKVGVAMVAAGVFAWVFLAFLYKIGVRLFSQASVAFGWCLLAAVAGYFAGWIGLIGDAIFGFITFGLISGLCNGAAAAGVLVMGAKSRGNGVIGA